MIKINYDKIAAERCSGGGTNIFDRVLEALHLTLDAQANRYS